MLMMPSWSKLELPRGPSSPHFASKSLKDVDFLLRDDDDQPWVCRRPSLAPLFHRVLLASSALRSWQSLSSSSSSSSAAAASAPVPADEEKRIVLYYTSLHVVRTTFEDCRAVRSILSGFRLAVDERDVFMDAGFLAELDGLLQGRRRRQQDKQNQRPSLPSLPQVFIGGRHFGGAEEIRLLHESGELKRHIEGVAPTAAGACEGCGGDARFVVCGNCSGSRKCFVEKGGGATTGFRSCTACNENGLVRCQRCF